MTRKIVAAACRIARGSTETLSLGNIEILRDWGWAPEYAVAMWLMLQRDDPQDYVIGTGMSYTLREFVEHTFKNLGLDYRNHIQIRSELQRPSEIFQSRVDPSKARMELGWQAQSTMPDVVRMMVADELGSPTESEQPVVVPAIA